MGDLRTAISSNRVQTKEINDCLDDWRISLDRIQKRESFCFVYPVRWNCKTQVVQRIVRYVKMTGNYFSAMPMQQYHRLNWSMRTFWSRVWYIRNTRTQTRHFDDYGPMISHDNILFLTSYLLLREAEAKCGMRRHDEISRKAISTNSEM